MDEISQQELVGPQSNILEQQASTYEPLTKRFEQNHHQKDEEQTRVHVT